MPEPKMYRFDGTLSWYKPMMRRFSTAKLCKALTMYERYAVLINEILKERDDIAKKRDEAVRKEYWDRRYAGNE